jgi:hypothetical protein
MTRLSPRELKLILRTSYKVCVDKLVNLLSQKSVWQATKKP